MSDTEYQEIREGSICIVNGVMKIFSYGKFKDSIGYFYSETHKIYTGIISVNRSSHEEIDVHSNEYGMSSTDFQDGVIIKL